jgi:hypothetical protein
VSEGCPGIGCGALYPKEKILKIVRSTINAAVKSNVGDNEEG